MPTPRRSGAALVPISLVTPAFKGLNKQQETSILGPEWATVLDNCVFDDAGRVAARKGWLATSSAMSGTPVIEQLFEQIFEDGTTELISAAGSKLWKGFTTPTDITGASTVTVGNNWQFVNFNGRCIGFQQGEQPIGRTTGNFGDLTTTSGTWPTGNCAVQHSGRVWAADADKQTIKYCALLDDSAWATGAGNIDMSSVWPQGTDEIVALTYYNNRMIVFGKNQIVFFSDGQGSPLGLNPANIQVIDTLKGVGCIARDSIQQIEGGDLLFLSSQGIQSLGRLIQEQSNPIQGISRNVRDYLNQQVSICTKSKIRSVYSPENSMYLLCLPEASISFYFNTQGKLDDGSFRVTTWTNMLPYALARSIDGTLYTSLYTGAGGKIGKYYGQTDNGGTYLFDYTSAWLDLGEEAASYLKILKTITGVFYLSQFADLNIKWDTDFQGDFNTISIHLVSPGTSEWGVMEWGIGEWSGGLALRSINTPISGTGQYIRIGVSAGINGSSLAVQQLNLFAKIGRLARLS